MFYFNCTCNLKGIPPNIRTFNTLLHLVISNTSLFPNILAQIQQKGLGYDVATYNIIMRHYFMVFFLLVSFFLSFNTQKAGNLERSLEIESLMEKNGVTPNVITFNQLLHIWAKKRDPKKCNEVLTKKNELRVYLDSI